MGQTQSNTSQGAEPGQEYRRLASQDSDKRRELSQQSQDAWALNNRAKAKELSLAAKAHGASMDRNNALAAAAIFAFHNKNYFAPPSSSSPLSLLKSLFSAAVHPPHSALLQIDLHGLHVSEALEKVRAHLALCRQHGVERTTIITGRGLHSVDGVAKIRPMVEQLLRENKVRVVNEGRGNEGAFVIELVKDEADAGWGEWVWKSLFR